ncbi:MAG: acetyl-CoA carboxylase carboxyltransferase subunit alpha [Candidatus Schekmanbacteria bacterium]|nr:acetyl-CoA carboxylase carboxyltransferase subunit alpha [Candidatus Schekmanbacteria bacterium]
MSKNSLEFEKPIDDLLHQIKKYEDLSSGGKDYKAELQRLRKKLAKVEKEVFGSLTPWQKTQLARHPDRPYPVDYFNMMLDDFVELHGDRRFAEDYAIIGGMGMLEGRPVMIIGNQKGRDTKQKIKYNFGMANPEGYRKSLRLMKLAEKFGKPVITIIDTPGAYPGIGAEERGQSQAIAENLMEMAHLQVPIIAIVTGEGGSGGALALGMGDRVLMLENSVYSVISPESCAAILWRDASKAADAAEPLRLTAQDAYSFKIIDSIIPEPTGGAHRDGKAEATVLKTAIKKHLEELDRFSIDELLENRYNKYRRIGVYEEQ